jgi:hypothetical protein
MPTPKGGAIGIFLYFDVRRGGLVHFGLKVADCVKA